MKPMAFEDISQKDVIDLVEDLARATEAGTLTWNLFSDAEERFGLETPGGSVTIESRNNREHPFVLRLFDRTDKKIFEMQTEVAPFYNTPEMQLERLFGVARNSVFDVGGTIAQIRQSLDI